MPQATLVGALNNNTTRHSCLASVVWKLEMQRYIDILLYCDTLGSDTVSIHI